jgi:exo-1,4-beta-D-glucosaminidase
VHVQYSYDDRSVVVVNSLYRPVTNLKVTAKVYNLDMTGKFSREASLDAAEDSSTRVLTLPEITGLSSTYFVDLRLADAGGKIVSRNLYWLSTRPETLDWPKSDWYHTPTKTFADYSALNSLPPVELKTTSETAAQGDDRVTTVTVTNPGRTLAFAVRLKVKKGAEGDEILPVLWEDNYFALLPGETRRVTATWRARDLGRATPAVEVEGWNVK